MALWHKKTKTKSLAETAEVLLHIQHTREHAANARIDDLEVKLGHAHVSRLDAIDKQAALDEIVEIAEEAGL